MKKIITTLFMLFMLFACCTAYAQSEEVIMELFCNDTLCEDGRFYGGKLTLNSKVKAKLSNGEALAIVAQYDDEGNLLDVALSKNVVEPENDEITVSLLSAQETGIVKCMIFDAKTLEPICPAQVYAAYDKNVTIWADMLEPSHSTTSSTKHTTIEYYATPEASNTIKLYVAKNPIIKVNGVIIFESDIDLYRTYAYYITKIQFTENTEDAYYDVIDITVYEHGIVSEVLSDRSKILFQNGTVVTFDFEDELQISNFFDIDGNESSFEAISKGDILAMVVGELNGRLIPKNARNFSESISVYNLKGNYISGKLVGHDAQDSMMYINDIPYLYYADFVSETPFSDIFKNGEMELGVQGDFYLSINNSVIGFKKDKSSYNYGFIIQGAESNSTWDKCFQIKVILADGTIKTYNIADYVNVDGTELEFYEQDIFDIAEYDNYEFGDMAHNRVIEFKTNSDGEITKINFVKNDNNGYDVVSDSEYDFETNKLGNAVLSSDVIIFNLDVYEADDATVEDISSLYDECKYYGFVMSKTSGEYGIFVLTSGNIVFSSEKPIKIVDKAISYLYNDQPAVKVFYYTDESTERKSVMFTAESESIGSASFGRLSKGSLFDYLSAKDGVAETYAVIATQYDGEYNIYNDSFEGYNDKSEFVYGPISDIRYVNENVIITVNDIEYIIDNNTNEYYYDCIGSRPNIKMGNFLGAEVDIPDAGFESYVFMKLYEGKVTDIVSSSARIEIQ